jgi:signal transduction histidine kinase
MAADDFWDRHLAFWHGGFVVLVGLVAVASAASGPPVRWYGVAAEAAMIVWYLVVGRRALDSHRLSLSLVSVVPLIALFGVAVWTQSFAGFLLFALMPCLSRTMAPSIWLTMVAIAVPMSILAAAILVSSGLTGSSLLIVFGTVVVPAVMSVLLTLWIHRIIRQSAQRAELIAELERTRTELAAERHEAGIRAERERLAAEIHDTLAQGFTSILMIGQAVRAGLDKQPDTGVLGGQVDIITATARQNLAEARSLITAMAPADLADGTLADALRRLADRVRRDTGLAVGLVVTGTPHAPVADRDVVLLRAAQEALHNVHKHADAGTVHMELSYSDSEVALSVRDDGCGFDPDAARHGYGLAGIRHRAEAVGGRADLDTRPGAGTELRIALPVEVS